MTERVYKDTLPVLRVVGEAGQDGGDDTGGEGQHGASRQQHELLNPRDGRVLNHVIYNQTPEKYHKSVFIFRSIHFHRGRKNGLFTGIYSKV